MWPFVSDFNSVFLLQVVPCRLLRSFISSYLLPAWSVNMTEEVTTTAERSARSVTGDRQSRRRRRRRRM